MEPDCSTKYTSFSPPRPDPAEDQAADEGGNESVAVDEQGPGVGEQRQGQDGGTAEFLGKPVPASRQTGGRAASTADCGAGQHPDHQRENSSARALDAGDSFARGDPGDRHQDDRRGDAVVEPAFDVERAANLAGDNRVRHHGGPEGGVGRRERGTDQQSRPHVHVEHHQRGCRSQGYRQRQPDPEQPTVQAEVAPEPARPNP
jgi:hypothetical protein